MRELKINRVGEPHLFYDVHLEGLECPGEGRSPREETRKKEIYKKNLRSEKKEQTERETITAGKEPKEDECRKATVFFFF